METILRAGSSGQGSCVGIRASTGLVATGGGVGLLDGLFQRLNLFAFAVPVFPGNNFTVFEGSFQRLLSVRVPLCIGPMPVLLGLSYRMVKDNEG